MKKKACTEIGIESFGTDFDATVTQEELIAKIDELNASKLSYISLRESVLRVLLVSIIVCASLYLTLQNNFQIPR